MKRTTIFLGDVDRTAIQTIKDRYGVSSDSDAIRLALRVMAGIQNPRLLLLPLAEPGLNEASERAVGDLQQR
jgi:Arc/MetJ family transcription regulator